MAEKLKSNNFKTGFVNGLTALMLTGTYSVCVCAVTGINTFGAFLCTAVCLLCSLGLKNAVFAPDAFLLVPAVFVLEKSGTASLCLSVLFGSLLFLLLSKVLKNKTLPDCVISGAALGLALCATVILTNDYFGIGAHGSTSLEMLKMYRSIGFHPNFRGLLYGTITLFLMITYPFKFKKLSKIIPQEFITLVIPTVLNLFLNPDKPLTTINEVASFSADVSRTVSPAFFTLGEGGFSLVTVIKGGIAVALILTAYTSSEKRKNGLLFSANAAGSLLSGIPVRPFEINGYSPVSAITALLGALILLVVFPGSVSRIPLHSVGALLIVSCWQNVPYRLLASSFKEKSALDVAAVILTAVSFVALQPIYAFAVCLLFLVLVKAVRHGK